MALVPSAAGRLSFVGCICAANAGMYLMYGRFPSDFASSAGKFGEACGLLCLVFLNSYRTSLKERVEVPDAQLSKSQKTSKSILRYLKTSATVLGGLCVALVLYMVVAEKALGWITPIEAMALGSFFLIARELAGVALTGKTFIEPEVHKVAVDGGLFP